MTSATVHVFKSATESRMDEAAGYADDAELVLALEADTAYWIEVCVECYTPETYGGRIYHRLTYSGTMDDTQVHVCSRQGQIGATSSYPGAATLRWYTSQGGLETEGSYAFDSQSLNSNHRGAIWYSGRVTTDSAGNLRFNWRHYDNGGAPETSTYASKVFAGSFMYAKPLDICPV